MRHLLIIVLLLVGTALCAVDFNLTDGSVVIGELKGIQDDSMYIVDASNLLHIVPIASITTINSGYGDVSVSWKRKKPFMDIDPATYTIYIAPKPELVLDRALPQTTGTGIDINQMSDREFQKSLSDAQCRELRRVSNTMWTIFAITIGLSVAGFIAASN